MTHTDDQLTATERIIQALDELQEIHGTEYLTYEVIGACNKPWVRCILRRLEADGLVTIERGTTTGRGHKSIIRRNRNSPGYPSRRDKHKRQIP